MRNPFARVCIRMFYNIDLVFNYVKTLTCHSVTWESETGCSTGNFEYVQVQHFDSGFTRAFNLNGEGFKLNYLLLIALISTSKRTVVLL